MITVDWLTQVISVPQADLTSLGGGIYELDADEFRIALNDIEDSEDGIAFPAILRHSTQSTLSGVTYVRQVEIINGYTIEFEDGQYTVQVVGANHNFSDVKVVNQVSMIIGNSAGLIVVDSGGGGSTDWTISERNQIRHRLGMDGVTSAPAATPSLAAATDLGIVAKLLRNKRVINRTTGIETIYDDDGVTPLYTRAVWVDEGGSVQYDGTAAPHRVERYA